MSARQVLKLGNPKLYKASEIVLGSEDGVIIGCTMLLLILTDWDTPVVLPDTLALHADVALDYALA